MTYWQGGIEHQDYCQAIDGRPCSCGASERGFIGNGWDEAMSEPIFLGTVEFPDDGIRYEDGGVYYYPEFDVNGVHAALLDPLSNYGKPSGMDLRAAAGLGKPQ